MPIIYNQKILIACFLIPFVAPFPLQFLRHCLATGYGGYFDQPGVGWVVLFGCVMGGLAGAICASLYLVIANAQSRNPMCLAFLLVALVLVIPLVRFQSNDAENERDRFIRWAAYQLFYAPVADSAQPVDTPMPAGFPVCIAPNTQLEVIDKRAGNFSITTGMGSLRTYSWSGASRSVSMTPSVYGENRRLNYPGDLEGRSLRWPGFDWKMHDGIARCCSIEQVLNFQSVEKAIEWIHGEKDQGIPFVYRNDGLVVLVSKHIEPDTLWIMVHQLLIKGHKPTRLPGADDENIRQRKLSV